MPSWLLNVFSFFLTLKVLSWRIAERESGVSPIITYDRCNIVGCSKVCIVDCEWAQKGITTCLFTVEKIKKLMRIWENMRDIHRTWFSDICLCCNWTFRIFKVVSAGSKRQSHLHMLINFTDLTLSSRKIILFRSICQTPQACLLFWYRDKWEVQLCIYCTYLILAWRHTVYTHIFHFLFLFLFLSLNLN